MILEMTVVTRYRSRHTAHLSYDVRTVTGPDECRTEQERELWRMHEKRPARVWSCGDTTAENKTGERA